MDDSKLPRALGAFSVFFTFALPAFAALVAKKTYVEMVNFVARNGATTRSPLAEFFFNDFKVAASLPLLVGVVGAAVAFLVWRKREADTTHTLARILVIQTLVAFATFVWFAAYLVAAVKG